MGAGKPIGDVSSVLVIGGGLAAFHLSSALRRSGFSGDITVVGAEPHRPYDRPPLSKSFLTGVIDRTALALDDPSCPVEMTWLPGQRATKLSPAGGTVELADGTVLTADAVVIATGSDAVTLGPRGTGVHVLRTIEDTERLIDEGIAGRQVVAVGGGFLALESAAAAVSIGAASVTVVCPQAQPLLSRFGPEVAASIVALHERHGVHFLTGERISSVLPATGARPPVVEYVDGHTRTADIVVVAVGSRPATQWLANSGIVREPDGAIACDQDGSTSIAGVWAIGDCASWSLPGDSRRSNGTSRTGHWQDALDHAASVAAAITAQEPPQHREPYWWSDQYEVRLQFAGQLSGSETAVIKSGSVGSEDLLVGYELDGDEVAILGMNRPRDVLRWRRTRERHARPSPAATRTAELTTSSPRQIGTP